MNFQRIQLTATTPTNSAVRLETGAVEFQLSNRVQNVSGATQPNPYMKLFGKAQVDINLSLGQLLKNVMFEEAEPEFQQFAFFNTRIGLRNAFQEEMAQGDDKEVVLITLKRPLIYIQPMAVDKAILVWLNYKNAYEYWNEKRANLNKEVLTATQQVFEKVPFGQLTSQLSAPHLGTLFLQLTIDDIGICIPLNPLPPNNWGLNRGLYDSESRGAVVITLENTSISACSSGSLVSKGRSGKFKFPKKKRPKIAPIFIYSSHYFTNYTLLLEISDSLACACDSLKISRLPWTIGSPTCPTPAL